MDDIAESDDPDRPCPACGEDRDHPVRGHHRERGVSDVTAVLGGVLCAAAVLWCSGTFGGGL